MSAPRLSETQYREWLAAIREAARNYREAQQRLKTAEHEIAKAIWSSRAARKDVVDAQREFIAVFALLGRALGEYHL